MLPGALGSVLSQTFTRFTVTVALDGDDDATLSYLAGVTDERVTLLADGSQRGEVANTFRAIQAVTTPFFAIIHDDDLWEPTLLERLLDPLLRDDGLAIAFADHYVMNVEGQIDLAASDANSRLYRRTLLRPGRHQPFYRLALIDQSVPAVMACVFRREAIDLADVPSGLAANPDYWLTWLAAKRGKGAYYVAERLSRYRVHAGAGTARARDAWYESAVAIYDRLRDEPELLPLGKELSERSAAARYRLALRRHTEGAAGRGLALSALRERPSLKGMLVLALTFCPRSAVRRVISA